jgi:peroxiredoxin
MRRLVTAVSVLSLIVALAAPAAVDAAAVVGKPAPSFSLKDTDGKTVRLDSFKGKVVVLEWTNYGCPFVKKHYGSGNMQSLQKKYQEQGVVWLSICSSAKGKQGNMTEAEAKAAVAEKEAAAPYLLDPKGSVGKSYGAKTTPHMFIIDAAGKVAYAGAIDDKPSTDPADVPKAKNYVADALDAVLAGQPVALATTASYGCSVKY